MYNINVTFYFYSFTVGQMKKFFCKLTILLSVIFTLCGASCSVNSGDFLDLYYFNTVIRIESHDKTISNTTKEKLKSMFSSLQNEFDCKDTSSFTYAFNNAKKDQTFTLSSDGMTIIQKAKDSYVFSQNKFDPSIYPLVELWQFAPTYPTLNFTVPDNQSILSALDKLDFDSVSLDQTAKTVTKLNADVKLDFGGIVKGYSADRACQILVEDGHTLGYVNVGGSSLNILSCKTLSVRHPRPTEKVTSIITINLGEKKNLSVSTSGDYEKTYSSNGKTYCHIIDTKTGAPINTNVASVTLIGVDGATADALTTAACTFNHDYNDVEKSDLIKFLRKILTNYNGCSVYAVYDNGNVRQLITNEKKDENFTLLDNNYDIVNI